MRILINKLKLIFLLWVLFTAALSNNYALSDNNIVLKVFPKEIDCGDAVYICVSGGIDIGNAVLKIISPLGRTYIQALKNSTAKKGNEYCVTFFNTNDKGFLSKIGMNIL